MNINRNFSGVKSKKTFIDKAKTLDAIREKYGSVQEYCRRTKVNPRTFYRALHGDRGIKRAKSLSLDVLKHLEEEKLLASNE
jgi:hypothetical protein